MKKILIGCFLVCILITSSCFATDINSIFNGIRNGIDVLSDINRLKNEISQPNAKQQDTKKQMIKIVNPDMTYTYKTPDGTIILKNTNLLVFTNKGVAVFEENGKYGLINIYGEKIVDAIYDYVGEYFDGMCAFFIQDLNGGVKIGYFDEQGNVVIEPITTDVALFSGYSYDYNFHNGIALYRSPKNQKYGYINKQGNFIIEPVLDWAGPFTGNLAPVSRGDTYGYIDKSGVLKIPYKFAIADPFSDGLAAVNNGDSWGYINESGQYVIPPQFGSFEGSDGELIAEPFIDGIAAVYLGKGQAYRSSLHKGQFALIDKTGRIINGQKYDSIRRIRTEHGKTQYFVKVNGQEYTLDSKGNKI